MIAADTIDFISKIDDNTIEVTIKTPDIVTELKKECIEKELQHQTETRDILNIEIEKLTSLLTKFK